MSSFYRREELNNIGFKEIGDNVKISRNACFYSVNDIVIGNNVRIDDFCILSGKIKLGNNIHISAYTGLFAGDVGIYLEDFCTVSSRCCIYALNDDYSGDYLTNPMVPSKWRNVKEELVLLKTFSIIGSGCTILPGVTIGEGVAVGAMSLVKDDLENWNVYAGVPCKKIKERNTKMLRFFD